VIKPTKKTFSFNFQSPFWIFTTSVLMCFKLQQTQVNNSKCLSQKSTKVLFNYLFEPKCCQRFPVFLIYLNSKKKFSILNDRIINMSHVNLSNLRYKTSYFIIRFFQLDIYEKNRSENEHPEYRTHVHEHSADDCAAAGGNSGLHAAKGRHQPEIHNLGARHSPCPLDRK
jgi:hypothetical protein